MKKQWLKYLDRQAPRYTSYPSALRFDGSVDAALYSEKLRAVDLYEPLSIYVHIPFCRQLCWYCGCNMRVENNYDRVRAYVDALLDEICIVGGVVGGKGRIANVHFGGGTPNILVADDLACILDAIERELGLTDDARLAIELDPRLMRKGDARMLAELGFDRMSLGVQDFDIGVQWAINRMQRFEMVAECVSDMREAGVDDISFDLLYGLPKQTPQSFSDAIDKAISLAPDRFAVFGYAHLPRMIPRQRMICDDELPGVEMRAELAALADERLAAAGYLQIGFDHYARPGNALAAAMGEGRLHRNFQGFTDDVAETTIGFGASAISFVHGVYAQNDKDIGDYQRKIAARTLPVARGIMRTARDERCAAAITRLLCDFETDLGAMFELTPEAEQRRIDQALAALERDDVIRRRGAVLRINDGARSLCRVVAASIDPWAHTAQKATRETAKAV